MRKGRRRAAQADRARRPRCPPVRWIARGASPAGRYEVGSAVNENTMVNRATVSITPTTMM